MDAKSPHGWTDHRHLPWLLSLAKTTAMLAGRCAATLTVGNCGISPYLETYFRSPAYSFWLESDLFAGGFDPTYESLVLAPIETANRGVADSYLESRVEVPPRELNDTSVSASQSTRSVMPSDSQLAEFLEEVASGHGRGGQFAAWLREAFSPSDAAYQMIKRQAYAGADGELLDNAERAILAALLKHGNLDGDAMLITFTLVKLRKRGGADDTCGGDTCGSIPVGIRPRRFSFLWKSVAKVSVWFVSP